MDYYNPNEYWMPDISGLTEEEQEEVMAKTLLCGCGMYVLAIIVAFVILLLMSGCTTTKYVPVIEHKTDTLIQTRVQHDSVYQKDSIHIRESGDTVYFTRWRTQLVKNEVHDTTYISKTDSVPVPYPVTEYMEKSLSWWQRTQMYAGDVLLVLLAGLLGFGGYKIFRLFV